MKNKLSDLNDHLFAQLERLAQEDLPPEQIDREVQRGEAIVGVADQIIRNAALQLQAAKLANDFPRARLPPLLETRPAIDVKPTVPPERTQ